MAPFSPWVISAFAFPSGDAILPEIIKALGGSPADSLRLETDETTGIRGAYLNRAVRKRDVILQMPLASCLREPPVPFETEAIGGEESSVSIEPWVPRLAARLLEARGDPASLSPGQRAWLDLLPGDFRECLPVHWEEDILEEAEFCEAFRSAARAAKGSRERLVAGLSSSWGARSRDELELAVDLAQTRACRVESSGGSAWRVLVPVVDMINHGVEPNAEIGVGGDGGDCVVVRALRDVERDGEIFIGYGEDLSAWNCLLCYGFVPEYVTEGDAAELVVENARFQVSLSELPVELIRWQSEKLNAVVFPEMGLTPEIGGAIVERLKGAAKELEKYPVANSKDSEMALALLARLKECHRTVLLSSAEGLQEYLEGL